MSFARSSAGLCYVALSWNHTSCASYAKRVSRPTCVSWACPSSCHTVYQCRMTRTVCADQTCLRELHKMCDVATRQSYMSCHVSYKLRRTWCAWVSSKRSNLLDPRDIHELHIPCEMSSHTRHTRCDNCANCTACASRGRCSDFFHRPEMVRCRTVQVTVTI